MLYKLVEKETLFGKGFSLVKVLITERGALIEFFRAGRRNILPVAVRVYRFCWTQLPHLVFKILRAFGY